jgi:hypothetical protein
MTADALSKEGARSSFLMKVAEEVRSALCLIGAINDLIGSALLKAVFVSAASVVLRRTPEVKFLSAF